MTLHLPAVRSASDLSLPGPYGLLLSLIGSAGHKAGSSSCWTTFEMGKTSRLCQECGMARVGSDWSLVTAPIFVYAAWDRSVPILSTLVHTDTIAFGALLSVKATAARRSIARRPDCTSLHARTTRALKQQADEVAWELADASKTERTQLLSPPDAALDCSREVLSFRRSQAGHGVCIALPMSGAVAAFARSSDQALVAGHLDIRAPIPATSTAHAGHTR